MKSLSGHYHCSFRFETFFLFKRLARFPVGDNLKIFMHIPFEINFKSPLSGDVACLIEAIHHEAEAVVFYYFDLFSLIKKYVIKIKVIE